MKSIALLVAICAFGSALGQTAPNLPQQFTANFTIDFPSYVSPLSSLINIGGFVAFDYVNGGMYIDLGGEEFVPLSFHTNLLVSPNGNTLSPYIYEGPLCWKFGSVPSAVLTYSPFQIPDNSTFLGNKMVNGQPCTGWQFYPNVFGIVTLITPTTIWVSTKTNAIVQMKVEQVDYVDEFQINFFNTVIGPFSPSIYAAPTKTNPNLICNDIHW